MRPKNLRPAWLEVSKSALAFNCRNIKKKLGREVELLAVVKANAYGHGAVECSQIFLRNGATSLGVAIIEEGIELRRAGIKAPILVVYPELAGREELVLQNGLEQTLCDLRFALNLSRLAVKKRTTVSVYLKLDTGMGRYGLSPAECVELVKKLVHLPGLKVKGLMSHFSSAFMKDKSYSYEELQRFRQTLELLQKERIDIPIKSMANSSATLDLPESYYNQARVGILLYGIYPSAENLRSVPVKPAASLKARISFLKKVPRGTPISYMRTYHTRKDSVIATLPLGYCDGYNFLLSNQGVALLRGEKVPVVGRVCMDTLMVDVTSIPKAKLGDELVFIGHQNGKEISLDEVAQRAGTISYDIITRMGKRLPLVYTR